HLIHELLPPKGDGMRWSNSDPITGQAAWFDLRVKVEAASADEAAEVSPQFDQIASPPGLTKPDAMLRYGIEWTKSASKSSNKGE
ncbi:MAG: hypothetical protein ACO20L_03515, partial [Candidatus Puniceispirillaceae bacterium]